jgi:hypothetical protein
MKWSYFYKHWFTTLLLGSVLTILVETKGYIFNVSIDWYLIIMMFSLIYSFPTFTIIAFVFEYFGKTEIDTKRAKTILILTTIFGVILTQLIVFGQPLVLELSLSFSIAAIISGMIFKLKRKNLILFLKKDY